MAKGEVTKVVFVLKRHAKSAKNILEQDDLLDKRFRLSSIEDDTGSVAIPIKALPTYPSAMFLHQGIQFCQYSTAKLGNNKLQLSNDLTLVQYGLLKYLSMDGETMDDSPTLPLDLELEVTLIQTIRELDIRICPRKLEFIGDDRTLVIPRYALDPTNKTFGDLLPNTNDLHRLWQSLAKVHNAHRVVRRGEIDPTSSIRESGHFILWPNYPESDATGPNSHGWITVTEQGISQSFDLTKVMFSRGNVTEKIRFGSLVQPNEVVLDLYAGIGYYTLPALVKGKARHVYSCEWNPHAAFALQYNLNANHVNDRATVYVGDSRTLCKLHSIVNMVDRVSLGLLPSSEGGWRTALRALRHESGGWLHVHANVPVQERSNWTWWLCQSLSTMITHNNWIVYCQHVEKVKSFAPTVNHYVADVFCGPRQSAKVDLGGKRIGVRGFDGGLESAPEIIRPPSCALDENGVLHQAWLMEEVEE